MTAPGIIGRAAAGVGKSKTLSASELRSVLGTGSGGLGTKYLADDSTWKAIDLSSYLTSATAASTYVALAGSYSNPTWLVDIAQSKVTGLSTALSAKADLVGGYVPTAQIPAIAITEYLGSVASQAAMLALVGDRGDWCLRSDLGTTWVLSDDDSTLLASWTQLLYPTAPVTSVAGRTGVITLSNTDISGLGTLATQNGTFSGTSSGTNTGDQDLSSYLTSSTAASTYLPLAGGTLTGNLLFTDATYDIGASGATRPRDGFFSRDFVVGKSLTVSQSVSTSGSPTAFTITGAAHTTLTASTESTDINFNLARTVQFSTGALTTQRAFRIQAPTYAGVGAMTIATASTLSVSGPPVAGTNATITNAYALNVESGVSKLGSVAAILDSAFAAHTWNNSVFIIEQKTTGTWQTPSTNSYFMYGADGNAGRGSGLWISATAADPHFGWMENLGTVVCRTRICRDADYVVALRNSTNPFTFRVYSTYISTTAYETLNLKGKSSANFEIGPENGSAGGTLRGLTIGGYPAGTATIVGWAQFRPNTTTGVLEAFYLGPIADSTATGGNARGTNSVDLQFVRGAANQVASGTRSILIGSSSRSYGTDSIAIGTEVEATNAGVAIGFATFSTGTTSSVAIGANMNASGLRSTAIGAYSSASGSYSFACGSQAGATRYGQFSYASNIFAAQGDAQFVLFVLRQKTSDATPVTLRPDGTTASERLTIPSGKIMFCDILISGIKSDGSAAACYKRKVAIKNVGGTTALVGTPETIGTDIEDNALTDVTITADVPNNALDISVTGIAGETWRWVAVVEGLEIAYGT